MKLIDMRRNAHKYALAQAKTCQTGQARAWWLNQAKVERECIMRIKRSTYPAFKRTLMKARDMEPNTLFEVAGTTYRMLKFVQVWPHPYFIVENVRNSYVFDSQISPDFMVTALI